MDAQFVVDTPFGTVRLDQLPPAISGPMLTAPKRGDGWWDMRYSASKDAQNAYKKACDAAKALFEAGL